MERDLNGLRALLRDSVFLGLLGLGLLFGGLVGAVSWNSWATPEHPYPAFMEKEEVYQRRVAAWQMAIDERGRNAVVPLVWAVPMTVTGLLGAGVCAVVLIVRNAD